MLGNGDEDFTAMFDRVCSTPTTTEVRNLVRDHAQTLRGEGRDPDGTPWLARACRLGACETVKEIVDKLVEPGLLRLDAVDPEGRSALHFSVDGGKEMVKRLTRHFPAGAADWKKRDNNSCTPFMRACSLGLSSVVEAMLSRRTSNNFDLDGRGPGGRTALSLAVEHNQLQVVTELLNPVHGIDVNLADDHGRTPFWHACKKGNHPMIRVMLSHMDTINVEIPDNAGEQAYSPDSCGERISAWIRSTKLLYDARPQRFKYAKNCFTYPVGQSNLPDEGYKAHLDYLGHGAGGVVFRGTFTSENKPPRKVAVKVVAESPLSAEQRIVFDREVNVWAALRHDNVFPMIAYCASNNCYLIASNMADGGDLFSFLYLDGKDSKGKKISRSRKTLLPPKEYAGYVLHMLLDVAKGLEYLHKTGIVHGDLKPGNTLVHGKRAQIADFGTSRVRVGGSGLPSSTNYGPGTVRFSAPEIYNPQNIFRKQPPSDIFSFGVMLFQAVKNGFELWFDLGQKPHEVRQVQRKICNEERPDIGPGYLADLLRDLISRCWAHDPAARPSASRVVEDLEKIIATEKLDRPNELK